MRRYICERFLATLILTGLMKNNPFVRRTELEKILPKFTE